MTVTLKQKRLKQQEDKKIKSLDTTEKLHLTPEQRYTFHYLSSEYHALSKIINFIGNGGIYSTEVMGIITRYLYDKREQLTHEFNTIHGVTSKDSFAIMSKDVDHPKMNINIHTEVVNRIALEYQKLIENTSYVIDSERYSKDTIRWLNLLTLYRTKQSYTYPVNNPSQILYHLIQTIGNDLSNIVESCVNDWLEGNNIEKTVLVESSAVNVLLYHFNNFILNNTLENPYSYLQSAVLERLNAIEEKFEQLNDLSISELEFVIKSFIFQSFIADHTIDGSVVKDLLTVYFTQLLTINHEVINPAH